MFFLPSKGNELLLTIVTVWKIASIVNQPDVQRPRGTRNLSENIQHEDQKPIERAYGVRARGEEERRADGGYWDN
jgi:hypothetical protein